MAWPKLRNKSSGPLMTGSKRSGATHDGARSHGGPPQGASGGSARGPAEPAPDAPAARPGHVEHPEPVEDEAAPPEVAEAEVAEAEVGAAEPESADLPLWDWSPPGESVPEDEPAARPSDPPRSEWKLVVTPVEEVKGAPGIGQRRGNLAHLFADPRMRVWQLRVVVAVVILVAFSILVSWQFGLTLAVLAIVADTIYRSRRGDGGKVRLTGAQRKTRRQLAKLGRAGYRALHGSAIPGSEDQIDHLVVGPAGVFAIDSEAWDKHLVVRARNARQLWHGPFSKKDRLEHAQWEAQRAADLLSGAIGKPVAVRPAMAVYGPKIPWDVATIREVDVFSGPRLRKYLRRRARQADVRPLTDDEIEKIYTAANEAFPHLSSGSLAS
jgi:Nuclease-related domain